METLDPVINLLTLLTALSVVAERLTNVIKERYDMDKADTAVTEKQRDHAVHGRAACVGIGLALVLKADFFTIVQHINDPWGTIGWVRVEGDQWYRATELRSIGAFIYTILGCVVTGWALGFGSKFWHDVLSIVNEFKKKKRAQGASPASPLGPGGPANPSPAQPKPGSLLDPNKEA